MQPTFTKNKLNKLKKFKRSLSPGSAFALSIFGSRYSDAVLGTVRLIANKIKGCGWLRLFNHLPINSPSQCISTTSTPTNVTTCFMFLKMTDEKLFDRLY